MSFWFLSIFNHVNPLHTGFCGLDIATNDPNVCFVCVVLFYLILSKKRKEKIDKDCLLQYSWSRFFSFLEDN